MESSLLVLLGFQAGCRLGQLFHQYVQQTRVTGLGDQEYHETSLNCPLMWGSQAEVVSEGLHFGCLRHKTASPQWSANVTGPANRREASQLPFAICHGFAKAPRPHFLELGWKPEAGKLSSRGRRRKRAWEHEDKQHRRSCFFAPRFSRLFSFSFFRTSESPFSFTPSH